MPPTHPPLIGTYTPPAVRKSDRVACLYRDAECVVTGFHDARIPWPRVRACDCHGGSGLWVNDTLLKAIRTESAEALKHWFGVGTKAVWSWRRAFGKTQFGTPGSAAAHAAASEEGAAATRGKPVTPARRKQLREHLAAARKKVRRGRWDETGWTREQLALLGTADDEVIAAKVGRSRDAVRSKRSKWKILPAPR
jgi:hypothetical protein